MKYFFWSILALIQLYAYSQSGKERSFYQEELDYLPHFKELTIHINKGYIPFGCEFTDCLGTILNSCSDKKYSLNSYFGFKARTNSVSPIGGSQESYFVLKLDKTGNLTSVDVYNTEESKDLEKCLFESLSASKINPGLKDQSPVSTYFVFKFYPLKKTKE